MATVHSVTSNKSIALRLSTLNVHILQKSKMVLVNPDFLSKNLAKNSQIWRTYEKTQWNSKYGYKRDYQC